MSRFRTQLDPPLPEARTVFPPNVVQSGMSPSISQMVKTRRVGGNLDEYEMNGIPEDAPFDSEYYDFFDMADQAQALEVERQTSKQAPQDGAKQAPQDGGKPPKNESTSVDSSEPPEGE